MLRALAGQIEGQDFRLAKQHGQRGTQIVQLMIPEQQRLLETFTLLVASALERLTLTASEEQARLPGRWPPTG
jgi:K+-sensing histidine kinase KdpD